MNRAAAARGLADEPAGDLDAESGRALMARLLALRDAGATICLAIRDRGYAGQTRPPLHPFKGCVTRAGGHACAA